MGNRRANKKRQDMDLIWCSWVPMDFKSLPAFHCWRSLYNQSPLWSWPFSHQKTKNKRKFGVGDRDTMKRGSNMPLRRGSFIIWWKGKKTPKRCRPSINRASRPCMLDGKQAVWWPFWNFLYRRKRAKKGRPILSDVLSAHKKKTLISSLTSS